MWKTPLKNAPVLTIATPVRLVALPSVVLRKNQCLCCLHDLRRTAKKTAWESQQSEMMFAVPWKVFSDMQLISKFSISHCLQNIAAGVENGWLHPSADCHRAIITVKILKILMIWNLYCKYPVLVSYTIWEISCLEYFSLWPSHRELEVTSFWV